MFVLTQNLDNLGADQCVLEGYLMLTDDIAARTAYECLSRVWQRGRAIEVPSGDLMWTNHHVAIRTPAEERDVTERQAQVAVLLERADVHDLDRVESDLRDAVIKLDRTVAIELLLADIEEWSENAGKARRRLSLRPLWRWFLSRFNRQRGPY